jgi:hypothetical protein
MMRNTLLACLLVSAALIPATPARAALTDATTFYVDGSAGSNNNPGCFVIGSTGTNFVLNAGKYNFTDLVITGTATIVSSASHNFVAADVGNCMRITAGTGFTLGVYRIVSVAANLATLDRSAGTIASTGGTYFVGGFMQTINATVQATGRVGSEQIFVKASATYTITADITLNTTVSQSATVPPNQLVGYTTTPGDGGRASITLSTNTGLTAINGTGVPGWYIRNFTINCSSLGTSRGISLDDQSMAINVKISNCTTSHIAITAANFDTVMDSELTACTSACTAAITVSGQGSQILRNWIHDNASPGITGGNRQTIIFNLFTNNTGASSDAIASLGAGSVILNNTIYKSGRDAIRSASAANLGISAHLRNNLLVSNVGAGITGASAAGYAAYPQYDGNAFFGNASTRVNMDDTGTVNAGNAAAPYTNVLDVILTCDPFVNAAADNYSLNSTSGCGAAARFSGTPGPFLGNATSTGSAAQGASAAGAVTRSSASAY